MKLMYEFEIIKVDDEWIAVPIDENADNLKGIIKLNQSGYDILELLKDNISEDQIISRLCLKYDNDKKEIEKYVNEAISDLQKAGIIVE